MYSARLFFCHMGHTLPAPFLNMAHRAFPYRSRFSYQLWWKVEVLLHFPASSILFGTALFAEAILSIHEAI